MGKDALGDATQGATSSSYDYSGFIYMAVVVSAISLIMAGISCKFLFCFADYL